MGSPALDQRQEQILATIIAEFIHTAEPVGSEVVVRQSGLTVSSATVRHEMTVLEEMGLLSQPHTSAGRVPTDLGYRIYVDTLLSEAQLTPDERQRLRRQVQSLTDEADRLVQRAARALAREVHYPSVVATARPQELLFRHLHFIPLDAGRVMPVLLTNLGVVEGQPVDLAEPVEPDRLDELSRRISARLVGMTLGEITRARLEELVDEAARYQRLLDHLRRWIDREVRRSAAGHVAIEGATHLLDHPEFHQAASASAVLSLLEREEVVGELLRPTHGPGVWVSIGSEHPYAAMQSCSLVAATYQAGGRTVGTLAILGPKRMHYERALPIVRFLAQSLGEALSNMSS